MSLIERLSFWRWKLGAMWRGECTVHRGERAQTDARNQGCTRCWAKLLADMEAENRRKFSDYDDQFKNGD